MTADANSNHDTPRQPSDAWYAEEGLAFECTGCGDCCTGAPGYVWVIRDPEFTFSFLCRLFCCLVMI